MKKAITWIVAAVFLAAGAANAFGAERLLEKKNAERHEVRHSMIGPRDTLLFYTFPDQQAVLQLRIRNANDGFPVSGTVFLFDPATGAEDLAKWLNNQHSDGLFPEVPEPVATLALPDGSCRVTAKKLLGEQKQPPMNKRFQDYQVTLSVKAHRVEGKFNLKAFEDQSGVFLEVTQG